MIYGLYAMRDIRTGFLSPALDLSDASAIRNFEHAVAHNDDSLFFSHPEDYSLYKVGEYDSNTGTVTPIDKVELATAASVVAKLLADYHHKEVPPQDA